MDASWQSARLREVRLGQSNMALLIVHADSCNSCSQVTAGFSGSQLLGAALCVL